MLATVRQGSVIVTDLLRSHRLFREEYPPLVRLAEGFRWVIEQHSRSSHGRCTGCPRTWWGLHPRWPCVVVRTIRSALTD
jgi:hypothetical protein